MTRALLVFVVALLAGCGPLSPPSSMDSGTPDAGDAGSDVDAGLPDAGGGDDAGTGLDGGGFTVDVLYANRSRPGARSTKGFRPWRDGIAVLGSDVTWVESGANPGLYRAPTAGCSGACVQTLATVTRPSVFAFPGDSVLVADVTTLRRHFSDGGVQAVATGSAELTNLATDGAAAFWTMESGGIQWTPFGGSTSTPIFSNGTPVAMAVAGPRVYWAGVDISGQLGALQSMRTDGTGAREESRFSNGFEAMGGNGSYLYYAKDSPARVLRLTLSNGNLEEVATNCRGVRGFALDGTYAWWVEPGSGPDYANGRVRRVAHESTTPETVAESVQLPVGIAVKDGVVYVASGGRPSASYADGAILRITSH